MIGTAASRESYSSPDNEESYGCYGLDVMRQVFENNLLYVELIGRTTNCCCSVAIRNARDCQMARTVSSKPNLVSQSFQARTDAFSARQYQMAVLLSPISR